MSEETHFMDEPVFSKLWNEAGLKYQFNNFFDFCVSRGLKGISRENFVRNVHSFMFEFIVQGRKDLPKYRRQKPKPDWYG